MKSSKRALARRIADSVYEEELSAILDKIRAHEERLIEMTDVEFAQAVRDYAARLVKDVESSPASTSDRSKDGKTAPDPPDA